MSRSSARVLVQIAAVAALWSLPVFGGGETDAKSPAKVLDLSGWKLTLPQDTSRPGNPDEVLQPELATFQDQDCFHVTADGTGVAFRARCGAKTTKGSRYPRCELREMDREGRDETSWSTEDQRTTHSLVASLAITQTPPVKPHVVCAQIHDADDDLLMVRLEGKKLFVERAGEGDIVLNANYRLGDKFQLKIQASGRHVQVWYDGALKLDWEVRRSGCYFKAGCYTQSNVARGDAPDASGEVVIYALAVTHADSKSEKSRSTR